MLEKTTHLSGVAIVVSVTLVYLGLWWNRYFGPTLDGYFAFFGHLVLAGEIPYRDFYLHVPPLLPLEHAFLERLFGPSLITARALGALERVVIAALAFSWLARIFSVRSAVLATLAMVIVGSSDGVDVLFLYNHHSVLWLLAAGLLASRAVERRSRIPVLELLAGVCAGLALLTKQTIGLGLTAALPAALVMARWHSDGWKVRARVLGACFVGWALPVGLAMLWLGWHDALGAAVDQVFLSGTSSKGPLAAVLTRAVIGAWWVPSLRLPAALALIAAGWLVFRIDRRAAALAVVGERRSLVPVLILGLLALVAAVAAADRIPLGSGWLHLPQRFAVLFSLYGCGALALWSGLAALRRALATREAQLLLFSWIAFASGLMFSTSWPSFEPIAIPALGLVLAVLLDDTRETWSSRRLHQGLSAGIALLMCCCLWGKLETPFDFAGWVEPGTRTARRVATLEALHGFALAPSTAEFLETTTRLIRERSTPEETVFVYPHLPVLYLLSERRPPTFAMIHWFDVCSDTVALADAARLRARPPAVVVDFELSEQEYVLHEQFFRSGQASGQREIRQVLRELESRYERLATLPAGGSRVTVWARPAP